FTSVVLGAVITNSTAQHNSSKNVSTIISGVVGGVGLAVLLLLIISLIQRHCRNRKKYLFDGNFDPAHVVVPTAPPISLPEEDNSNDRMGGRLGTGAGRCHNPLPTPGTPTLPKPPPQPPQAQTATWPTPLES
ncbi:hypothetical protein C0993_005917, partial [Termitomyces sp. T159_Od127]